MNLWQEERYFLKQLAKISIDEGKKIYSVSQSVLTIFPWFETVTLKKNYELIYLGGVWKAEGRREGTKESKVERGNLPLAGSLLKEYNDWDWAKSKPRTRSFFQVSQVGVGAQLGYISSNFPRCVGMESGRKHSRMNWNQYSDDMAYWCHNQWSHCTTMLALRETIILILYIYIIVYVRISNIQNYL